MPKRIINAAELLARELVRVSAYREHVKVIATKLGPDHLGLKLHLEMLDHSLEAACLACGTGDAITYLAAIDDLQGYEE